MGETKWADTNDGRGGEGAALIYDPKPGTVGVTLSFPDELSATLEVLAPASEVATALADARASLARRCGLPGEAPAADLAAPDAPDAGGTPGPDPDAGSVLTAGPDAAPALDTQVDEAAATSYVAGFVLDRLSSCAFMRAGIMPLGTPDVTVDELPRSDRDLRFTLDVLVRPACELTDYETPLMLSVSPEVTSDDVHTWVEDMARSLAAQSPQAGAPVPVIDDAWVAANMPEAGDLAGLLAKVEALLARTRRAQALDACGTALAERLATPVPERCVEVRTGERRDRMAERLAAQGMTLEEWCVRQGGTARAWEEAERERARRELEADFALDALADHLGLQVDEQTIAHALRFAAQAQNREEYDELAWCAETGQTHRLCEYALRLAAREWLLERATFAG